MKYVAYIVSLFFIVFVHSHSTSREQLPVTPRRAKIRLRYYREIRLSVTYKVNDGSNYQIQWITWPPQTSNPPMLLPLPERHIRGNVYEARARFLQRSRPFVYVFFLFPETGVTIGIMFDSEFWLTGDVIIPLNIPDNIGVEPGNELVYEPGQDLNFTTIKYSCDAPMISIEQVLTGPHTQNSLIKSFLDTQLFVPGEETNCSTGVEQEYMFRTPASRVSGFLQFCAATDHEKDNVKIRVLLAKQISLRPSYQNSTFPDGYIGIVRDHDSYDYHTGAQTVYCPRYYACVINCEAAGDNVTDITLTVKHTGEEVEGGHQVNFQFSDYNILYKDFDLEHPHPWHRRFLCIARNVQDNVDTLEILVVRSDE